MQRKTVEQRCCGAQRINDPAHGRGEVLKFVKVPYSMSGAFLNELCGLDGQYKHPLEGAVYYTENHEEAFDVTIFQNELADIAEAYAGWFIGDSYMQYANTATTAKILAAKSAV